MTQTTMCMSSILQKPPSYVRLAPNPVIGTKKNGKPAQESKQHALEIRSRNHAPRKLLLVIPRHPDC